MFTKDQGPRVQEPGLCFIEVLLVPIEKESWELHIRSWTEPESGEKHSSQRRAIGCSVGAIGQSSGSKPLGREITARCSGVNQAGPQPPRPPAWLTIGRIKMKYTLEATIGFTPFSRLQGSQSITVDTPPDSGPPRAGLVPEPRHSHV